MGRLKPGHRKGRPRHVRRQRAGAALRRRPRVPADRAPAGGPPAARGPGGPRRAFPLARVPGPPVVRRSTRCRSAPLPFPGFHGLQAGPSPVHERAPALRVLPAARAGLRKLEGRDGRGRAPARQEAAEPVLRAQAAAARQAARLRDRPLAAEPLQERGELQGELLLRKDSRPLQKPGGHSKHFLVPRSVLQIRKRIPHQNPNVFHFSQMK